MKRVLAAVAGIAALVLMLAGCGGTTVKTPTVRTVAPSQTTAAKGLPPCLTDGTAANFAMQCATPPTTSGLPTIASGNTYGIDSYGASNAGLPESFDCSYLSGVPGGKDWDSTTIHEWTGRGKHICAVWETSAARAYGGYNAGRDDAEAALRESRDIGLPAYVPLRFAVDTGTFGAIPSAIVGYFEGAHSILGDRTGAYGSYYIITGLEARGIITKYTAWQTVGWSYGHVSDACIYQYNINQYLDGYSVDYDVARPGCAAAFYEYTPPPAPIVCFGKHAENSSTCRTARADVAKWQKAVGANRRVSARLKCPTNVRELTKLRQRETWFAGKLRRYPHVKAASRRQAVTATRRAVNRERAYVGKQRCGLWSSRESYFAGRVAATERKYS